MELASLIISIVALIAMGVVIFLLCKKNTSASTLKGEDVQDMCDNVQEYIQKDIEDTKNELRSVRAELKSVIEATSTAYNAAMGPYMEGFNRRLEKLTEENTRELGNIKDRLSSTTAEITKTLNDEMKQMTASNEKKIEEMRQTVDEKLQSTLEKRINAAFEQVTQGLSEVQKRFGEMTELSNQVSNLNKTFMNVKTRGTWGEVSLEGLLEQMLAPEQYEKQYMLSKNSTERVDFVVKLPGKTDKDMVLLPIDSKFPIEDYNRLVDASEKGKVEEIQQELDSLKRSVKAMAKSIKDKYIKIPTTTDFAVMYLPTEGLYSEIVKDPALTNELRTNYKVLPCGPTVLAAMLNSFNMGFQTLKIQKNSGEIAKLLLQFQKDFGKFTDLLSKMKNNAESVVKSIDAVDDRRKKIEQRLSKVGDIAGSVLDNQDKAGLVLGDISTQDDE